MTAAPVERLEFSVEELRDAWPALAADERVEGFLLLAREEADDFFLTLSPHGQAQILEGLGGGRRAACMRLLAPDDAADVLQEADDELRAGLLEQLDGHARREVNALLAYAEDHAGGLMSPRFARARPDMRADEAIRYLQRQAAEQIEIINYVYVLDHAQVLLGVCSLRELFTAAPERLVREIMRDELVMVHEEMDQEAVARLFQQHPYIALPVVDGGGRLQGIVTVDDIVDVVAEEATEDAQKFGGMAALDAPYLQTGFWQLIRKRAGWLAVLFLGEMLTASAMSRFQDEIARAVLLAVFIPLIISSGGNSGSQASTLIIRAMAVGEVRLRDWWRILRRELGSGAALGLILALISALRMALGEAFFHSYGPHQALISLTVGLSLVGVVTLGTLAGSMLPFILRRLGLDPASASAPFVATLVDVSGLVIYFSIARLVLGGTLL